MLLPSSFLKSKLVSRDSYLEDATNMEQYLLQQQQAQDTDENIQLNNDIAKVFIIVVSLLLVIGLIMIIVVVVFLFIRNGYQRLATDDGEDEEDFVTDYGTDRNSPSKTNLNLADIQKNLIPEIDGFLLSGDFLEPHEIKQTAIVSGDRESKEFQKMSDFEIELYQRGKEFQKNIKTEVKDFGTSLSFHELMAIRDRGIDSFHLLPSVKDKVDEEGTFIPSFIINDKLNILFTEDNVSSTSLLNFPVPFNTKKTVYFEVKVYKFPAHSNTIFSIGLVTTPYPYFKLPGTSIYSIAYESTGKLRRNNPFGATEYLPALQEGDTVGFGYRYQTGKLFITHNGHRMLDVATNINVDMHVAIGALNTEYTKSTTNDLEGTPSSQFAIKNSELFDNSTIDNIKNLQNCELHSSSYYDKEFIPSDILELHLNIGQRGYVYPKANARKYAFTNLHGELGAPPAYNTALEGEDVIISVCEDQPPLYCNESYELDNLSGGGSSARSRDTLATLNNSEEGSSSDRDQTTNDMVQIEDEDNTFADQLSSLTCFGSNEIVGDFGDDNVTLFDHVIDPSEIIDGETAFLLNSVTKMVK